MEGLKVTPRVLIFAKEDVMRTPFSQCLVAILAVLLIMPAAAGADSILFSGAGANAAAIQGTVDTFRTAIGGVDNGNVAGGLATGRREINWDGGGAAAPVNTNMAKDTFLNNRGALFGPDTTIFSISGNGNPQNPRFGNINPTYQTSFQTFSSPRLFSPTNSIVTEQLFFIPGTGTTFPTTTTAFGAVFTDVDLANTTSIEYFNANGGSLGKFFAPTANNGLSFLGVQFTDGELISKIQITTGNTILGPNDGGSVDVVVMDDFIYSEPSAIPEPATWLLLGTGVAALWWGKRRLASDV
jgi:hypothetical protein